jgi:phage tail tape-measure protein
LIIIMNDVLSPEEQKLIKEIEEGKQEGGFGANVGSAIGTVAGGIGGALLGIPTGGALSLPLAATGAGIGGALGGSIGGLIGTGTGSAKVAAAEKRLAELQLAATKGDVEKQARQAAFEKLLGKYSSF